MLKPFQRIWYKSYHRAASKYHSALRQCRCTRNEAVTRTNHNTAKYQFFINQMQNLNQLRLGLPRFRAPWAVWLFSFEFSLVLRGFSCLLNGFYDNFCLVLNNNQIKSALSIKITHTLAACVSAESVFWRDMELPIERSKGCRLSVYEDPLENKEIIQHKNKKLATTICRLNAICYYWKG